MSAALLALMDEADLGSPQSWLHALVYLLAAVGCAAVGRSAGARARMRHDPAPQVWLALCALYLLCAANALVQADVLWVHWARDFARAQQLYDTRRLFQVAGLLGLLSLLAAAWKRQQTGSAPFTLSSLRTLLLIGASTTLLVHLLRFVSFHYTDLALNTTGLGHSLASWLEAAALGLVGAAAALHHLRRSGHV